MMFNKSNTMKKALLAVLTIFTLACHAQDQPIASYFQTLCNHYMQQYPNKTGAALYADFCIQYNLDGKDSTNIRNFFTIQIMHKLFTVNMCKDGSRGDILNMPYFWHYCTPNPRDAILVDGKKNIGYTRIERKPYHFLKDMVAPANRFTYPGLEPFCSFGWCSEREMAFACLLSLMGYKTHVISPYNHAYTEVQVSFLTNRGEKRVLLVNVDNTFNNLTHSDGSGEPYDNIYDKKAFNPAEVARVKGINVSKAAMGRIEKAMQDYIKYYN
jgi:hypothetical protein